MRELAISVRVMQILNCRITTMTTTTVMMITAQQEDRETLIRLHSTYVD